MLGVIGWGGLILLVFMTLPTLGPRWLFFFLATLAVSGTALPVVYFFNRRFPSNPPVDGGVVLREGMWVGVYASLLAWLQMGRVLTSGLALVLALGLVVIEFLLRMGERSQWSPGQQAAASAEGADDEDGDDDGYDEDDEDA